jgi:hypothetical protein
MKNQQKIIRNEAQKAKKHKKYISNIGWRSTDLEIYVLKDRVKALKFEPTHTKFTKN